jgi:formate dehydrogenase subunit delta
MTSEKLVHMANQIATFFASQPPRGRAEDMAKHLHDFWGPGMRQQLYAHVDAGGAGLSPLVIEAVGCLRTAA